MSTTKLDKLFQEAAHKIDAQAIVLSKIDGLSVQAQIKDGADVPVDKLSAVSSSLCSLANAASVQLIKSELSRTVVETRHGDMMIFKTHYQNEEAVLCVITAVGQNHAQARYFGRALADAVVNL